MSTSLYLRQEVAGQLNEEPEDLVRLLTMKVGAGATNEVSEFKRQDSVEMCTKKVKDD